MFPEKNLLSTDLDWMMQSHQVSDAQLIQIIYNEHYDKLYSLAALVTDAPERARKAVEKTLVETVSNRWRYWGNPSLKAWMDHIVLRNCREPQQKKRFLPEIRFLRTGGNVPVTVVSPVSNESLPTERKTLGKEFASLPPQKIILLWLRYVHGLTAPEISFVLKIGENSILAHLREIRRKIESWAQNRERGNPNEESRQAGIHRIYRQRLQAALDQHLKEEDQDELKQHLVVCAECQAYAVGLAALEEQISNCLDTCWPSPKATGRNPETILAGMGDHVGKTRRQRRISRLVKEAFLVVAAIVLVFAISSIGNLTAAGPHSTPTAVNQISASHSGNLLNLPYDPSLTLAPRRRGRLPPAVQNLPGNRTNELGTGPKTSQYLNFPELKDNWSPRRAMADINMSGPVDLHILLLYWGEQGNPEIYLQPNSQDKTVMFFEMVNFIEDHTRLNTVMRMAGDIHTIKDLLAAGIPVIVEMGFDSPSPDGWAGHYVIVNGFDDKTSDIVLLAALPEDWGATRISYEEFEQNWRAFNYSYLIAYPSDLNDQVQDILGTQADEFKNYQYAADKADADIERLTSNRELFFAWYNKGTSLTYLENYSGAKEAYDKAFSIYQSLPVEGRPWRILWYQTRPYWAYFYTGSYQMVIDLATKTLGSDLKPVLEESYYWRALAKEALGDLDGAIQDLKEAIQLNPNFIAGKYQLRRIKGES